MKKTWGTVGALLLIGSVGMAHAQSSPFSQLRVQPNPAVAGEPVNAVVHWGGCGYTDNMPTVQVSGHEVTVTAVYQGLCGVPRPFADVTVALGTFQPGAYTLHFVGVSNHADPSGTPDPAIDLPFRVSGGVQQPVSAPTGGWAAFMTLGALLTLFAGWRLRSRA